MQPCNEMEIQPTAIHDCFLLKPRVFEDPRGYFMETYSDRAFTAATGLKPRFVQDNQSYSHFGVLRGLHCQQGLHAQAKLVRVLQGEVLDVAVDLRPDSPTYGKVVTARLSAANFQQLYLPRGCAHGFVTLSKKALFAYKCDNFYHPPSESGLYYEDPFLGINWLLDPRDLIVAPKDRELPTWAEFEFEPLNEPSF